MKRPNTALTLALALWLAVADAQTPPAASTQRITPNYSNADIAVLAEAVGQVTGITFILDPRVRATVTLVNPRPMSPQELYQLFLSTLQVNGFAVVRAGANGRVMKIVPEANVRQMANNVPASAINAGSDEVIDAVIEAKNISGQQLNVVLRQLIPQSGAILSVPGTNSMIVTDRASNVFRLQRLVAQLDQAGANSGVEMITLQNSNASDVVRTLTTLMANAPAEAGGIAAPRIAADDRSNSVLISGEPAARQRVISYINNLDKAVNDNDNTEARYLKYARAEEVAAVLKQQATGITATSTTGGGAAAPAAAGPAADRNVTILADKPTNLLIITAPPKTRRALFATVDKMDIARAQVMIEAFIADVSMDKSRNLGVNWAVFSQEDGKILPGAIFNAPLVGGIVDIANTIANPGTSSNIPTGFVGGVGQLKDTGVSWAALISAIAADTETNVVAMPTQVTADNEEVNLESGQEVPFLTGQYTNSGNTAGANGNVNPFNTVQRQQIGTKLKITPQLNGSDAMTLTIDLESSELAGQSGDAGSAITNVRKFHNVVLVRDQQTIVVGGLIRDSKVSGETRVPYLGRIPLLGNLFKYRSAKRQKTNLMVFIRPTVLTDSLQASLATNDKYKAIREAQQVQGKSEQVPPMLPFDTAPLLPPVPGSVPGTVAPAGAAPQTSPVP